MSELRSDIGLSGEARPAIAWSEDDRHLAYFHVEVSVGNFLAWLVQRHGTYLILARTRIYKDHRTTADSADVRHRYERTVPVAASDYEAIAELRRLCDQLCRLSAADKDRWGLPEFAFHTFNTGTMEEVLATLALDPGMHKDKEERS